MIESGAIVAGTAKPMILALERAAKAARRAAQRMLRRMLLIWELSLM